MIRIPKVTMTMRELDRLKCIQGLIDGHLKQTAVAARLGLTTRQVRRLVRQYEQQGPVGLISKLRNRPSNRRLKSAVAEHAFGILRSTYADFGPTLRSMGPTSSCRLSSTITIVASANLRAIGTTRTEPSARTRIWTLSLHGGNTGRSPTALPCATSAKCTCSKIRRTTDDTSASTSKSFSFPTVALRSAWQGSHCPTRLTTKSDRSITVRLWTISG